MSDWEQHANLSLQSLGEAFQRGHIDRAEFRARRRRILQGIRERQAQTQPNALQPRAVVRAAASPQAAPGAGRGVRFVTAGTCAIIAVALLAWWWLRRNG